MDFIGINCSYRLQIDYSRDLRQETFKWSFCNNSSIAYLQLFVFLKLKTSSAAYGRFWKIQQIFQPVNYSSSASIAIKSLDN